MRTATTVLTLGCLLIALGGSLGGCKRNDRSPAAAALAARYKAAEAISDPTERDSAFWQLARDAADSGNTEMVNSAVGKIGNPTIRDASKEIAALRLGKAGKGDDALALAKSISDPTSRDRILGKLSRADYSP